MPSPTRRDVLQASVALGVGLPGATTPAADLASFHFDHVLGTSLDVWCTGNPAAVERVVLAEIERLRRIFSTYDPDSELSRLNRAAGPVVVSAELADVLAEYRAWHRPTGGACSAELGDLVRLWRQAGRDGVAPAAAAVARLAPGSGRPGWDLGAARRVVTRGERELDLNAVAKGFILERAARAVRQACPGVTDLLVNLGGDLRGFGRWRVGVQDPRDPAENARPLTAVRLADAAVATSGGYQRYHDVAGRRLSHLLDPRTGRPAGHVASATVVAPTSTLANALATTLCVLSPAEGLRLVGTVPGATCLIVTADGRLLRGAGFADLEEPVAARTDEPAAWPEGRQVTIALTLPTPTTGRAIRRPYVAVWIEDADGKAVRTLAVWGNSSKWINTLTAWWKIGRADAELVKAVSRATRAPGKYELVWDGKDDKGNALPQGTYTVKVEVHREHGKHLQQSGKIDCKGEDATATLEKNDETAATVVQYQKKP